MPTTTQCQTLQLEDSTDVGWRLCRRMKFCLMCIGPCIIVITEVKEPTRCYLLFCYIYDRLYMFRALLCPSSGAQDYSADYHMGRPVLGLLFVGHLSSLPAPNLQPTVIQEPDGPCDNQHYSLELLMMGIVVAETCWTSHKYNKTISSI